MKCDSCQVNPATIQVTTLQNGKKVQLYLCEQCAGKHSYTPAYDPLDDFFQSLLNVNKTNTQKQNTEVYCPMCHMAYSEFKKKGKAGCSHCYNIFGDSMSFLLKQIHGTTKHVGKVPAIAGKHVVRQRTIEILKKELKRAINEEAFEEAAELRDQIRALEKEGK